MSHHYPSSNHLPILPYLIVTVWIWWIMIKQHPASVCAQSRLLVIPWTVAPQAPLSTGFSRQQYWSGLPWSSPRNLPHPGIKLKSPALQVDSSPPEPPGKSLNQSSNFQIICWFFGWCVCYLIQLRLIKWWPSCCDLTWRIRVLVNTYPSNWY